ncbi:MAG: alpha/beta fold hydrolase [Candidatus Daviesbacteria bacterium]|nr:alpha/beta fold hydrolase [Candidatus Daviesbacteria bacterium]
MNKRVIIVHGWGGSSQNGWISWARKKLEKRYEVLVPDLPDTNYPKIEKWVPYLAQLMSEVRESDILIGHSMGCQTIMRFLQDLPEGQKVGRVILVAGFGSFLKGLTEAEWQVARSWIDTPLDLNKVRDKADSFVAVFSDNDPFVPLEENRKIFETKLGARIIIEKGQGHFNKNTLPILLDLI